MKTLDKNEALKLLESLEREDTELNDLIRNACSVIFSTAEYMTWQVSSPYENLFQAIVEITQAINDIRRYNVNC